MIRIVKTEFYKLKKYHILWAHAFICFTDFIYVYGK